MSFHAQKFCEDYGISWSPPGTENVGIGWIGIRCPFCGDTLNHGGFNIEKGYYSCHICRGKWMPKVIAILAKVDIQNAKIIIKKYSSGSSHHAPKQKYQSNISEIVFPIGTGPLTEKAERYLISRNFDPKHLVSEWNLLSTGNLGEYSFRILAPIYFQGQLVSYQCRDITGKNPIPYKGCVIEESIIPIKHTLYGFDKAIFRKKCIVVEGLMDNWRLGPGAVATFGIQFTPQQRLMLTRNFDEIFILYDPEDQAQIQADKLYNLLSGYNKQVEILEWPGNDPGDLSNEEAKYIMKEIGL